MANLPYETPTRPMRVPLVGDCARLPVIPNTEGLSQDVEAPVQLLGSAAKIAGEFVGLSIKITSVALGNDDPVAVSPMTLSSVWLTLFQYTDALARSFTAASREGWCTIDADGYAYPTQKLADFVLAQSSS